MRYFNGSEILLSCVVFLLFGIIIGILYFVFFFDAVRIKKILLCGIYVLKSKSYSPNISITSNAYRKVLAKIISSLYEFVFFAVLGLVYILLLYLCCDGVFRVYTFVICSSMAYIAYKLLSCFLKNTINLILDKIFIIKYSFSYATSIPIRFLVRKLTAMLSPLIKKVLLKSKEKEFKRQIIKKSKEQALILKNIY